MSQISTAQLAEHIAFKGRVADADEAMLLGFERAVVEIVHLTRAQLAERLRAKGHDELAAEIETMADVDHLTRSVVARHALFGNLAATGRPIEPVGTAEAFPPVNSKLWRALGLRGSHAYFPRRAKWERVGKRIGEEIDRQVLGEVDRAGEANSDRGVA